MTALLDDSLLFARLGNEAVALEVIDLVALTRELAAEMSVDPGDEQGSVSLSLPAQPVIVMGDRTALARIFNNLVENARRHASAVTVAIEDGPDAIEWRFEDDGPGVPPESLAELGQPFLRLDKSRDRRSGGAGLGLAIIKGLARSMNGSTRFYMCGMGGLGIAVSLPRKTD
jgi:signal transduction histidine kinase